MEIKYSVHWMRKKRYRADITDDVLEYAIINSNELRDKHREGASNAVCRVPQVGRTLKVVYRKEGKNKIRVITAFWLD